MTIFHVTLCQIYLIFSDQALLDDTPYLDDPQYLQTSLQTLPTDQDKEQLWRQSKLEQMS